MSRRQSFLYLFLAIAAFGFAILGADLLSGYGVTLRFLPDSPVVGARPVFFVIGAAFLMIGLIGLVQSQRRPNSKSPATRTGSAIQRSPASTPAQMWALAAGANLARRNGDSLGFLASDVKDPRELLSTWWDVKSAADFQHTLDWLEKEGHRKGFRALYQRSSYLHASELSAEDQKKAAFLSQNLAQFANGDLIAWDFSRLINVCRFGYAAGYISEKAAWAKIMFAAQQIQSGYSSWQEMSDNHDWGWRYWQSGAPLNKNVSEASNWLKTSPDSPWQKLPWNTPLR